MKTRIGTITALERMRESDTGEQRRGLFVEGSLEGLWVGNCEKRPENAMVNTSNTTGIASTIEKEKFKAAQSGRETEIIANHDGVRNIFLIVMVYHNVKKKE